MTIEEHIIRAVEQGIERALERHAQPIRRKAYSVAEAGEALGRSEQFVRDLIAAGELPARKAGPNGHLMVADAALDAWLAGEVAT